MKKIINLFFTLSIIGFFMASCQTELSFEMAKNNDLKFSKDTLYLDTIFTNTSSSTYQLKVYNQSNKNLTIPSIYLKKNDSKYRISIDGISGKSHKNTEILAKDSLFIFVETTVDIKKQTQDNEFLYTDELIFQTENGSQKVELVSLIQDAYFLYPKKQNGETETITINEEDIYGFFLDENDPINGNETHFSNEKPYVIYGYAAIPPNKTLTIDAGASIHFHKDSGLIAYPNSKLIANGTIESPITFQGNRLEPSFKDISGQWGMIFVGKDAQAVLKNTLIKNATIGLFVNSFSKTNTLENVQIYNCSNFGLIARYATIRAKNFVVNNCGKAALSLTYGGDYHFNHSTIANFWSAPSAQTLLITNDDSDFAMSATFTNSIITGKPSANLAISPPEGNSQNFSFQFKYCYIKQYLNSTQEQYPYNYNDATYYQHSLIAQNAQEYPIQFHNAQKNNLIPTPESTAIINYGSATFAQQAPYDILGNERTNQPDLGAYQNQEIPSEEEE